MILKRHFSTFFQVSQVFTAQICAVLTVWHLQYYQPMVINSLAVSFIPLAILSLKSQVNDPGSIRLKGFWQNVLAILVRTGLVLTGTLALNMTLKTILGQTDDNHIFQFVASWIGLEVCTVSNKKTHLADFETCVFVYISGTT